MVIKNFPPRRTQKGPEIGCHISVSQVASPPDQLLITTSVLSSLEAFLSEYNLVSHSRLEHSIHQLHSDSSDSILAFVLDLANTISTTAGGLGILELQ
jgi:hypothetical protein